MAKKLLIALLVAAGLAGLYIAVTNWPRRAKPTLETKPTVATRPGDPSDPGYVAPTEATEPTVPVTTGTPA